MLQEGETVHCALSWSPTYLPPADDADAVARVDATVDFWRRWLERARVPDHRYREPIQRSALAIKALTYMPTGATVAALTTGLPETPGGERNWDYRYSWMRDSTFTLQALHWLNLDWEADEFMQFVADLEPNDDGGMQIMYGIDGRRDLQESTLDHLSGYAGARPVRIGNGAYNQRQNDVFGAVLDAILLHSRRSQRLPRRLWPLVQAQATCATNVWKEPDQGIWEARGKPQHYVSSKLMGWVALDRASHLAGIRGDHDLRDTWRATAEEIRADILANGVSERGVLKQHYDTEALDASTLLAMLFGFLDGDDDRAHASVLAIADELTEAGFVLRYRTDETDDGLTGKEGTFLICSYWLVSALCDRRRVPARPRPVREAAPHRLAARPVRRGVRRRHRLPPRQLPAGVLAPRPHRGRRPHHPRGVPARVLSGLTAHRDRAGPPRPNGDREHGPVVLTRRDDGADPSTRLFGAPDHRFEGERTGALPAPTPGRRRSRHRRAIVIADLFVGHREARDPGSNRYRSSKVRRPIGPAAAALSDLVARRDASLVERSTCLQAGSRGHPAFGVDLPGSCRYGCQPNANRHPGGVLSGVTIVVTCQRRVARPRTSRRSGGGRGTPGRRRRSPPPPTPGRDRSTADRSASRDRPTSSPWIGSPCAVRVQRETGEVDVDTGRVVLPP